MTNQSKRLEKIKKVDGLLDFIEEYRKNNGMSYAEMGKSLFQKEDGSGGSELGYKKLIASGNTTLKKLIIFARRCGGVIDIGFKDDAPITSYKNDDEIILNIKNMQKELDDEIQKYLFAVEEYNKLLGKVFIHKQAQIIDDIRAKINE